MTGEVLYDTPVCPRTRREEYFPTVVFMTTNKLAQVVIGNWVLVMGVVIGKALQMLFLGRLRDNEVEVRFIFYPPAPLKINVCLKRNAGTFSMPTSYQ